MADEWGLSRLVGPGTFQRGRDYWQRGRAHLRSYDPTLGVASGYVTGSAATAYQVEVVVRRRRDGGVAGFDGDCSCPVGLDCKHAVALALAALEPALTRPSLTLLQGEAPGVDWERALAPLRDEPLVARGTAPLALGFEAVFPATGHQSGWWRGHDGLTYLQIRPLTTGKRGRWIRTGVSWSELASTLADIRFRGDQLDIVRRIQLTDHDIGWNSGYGAQPWLRMDTADRPTIWDLLAEAVAAGVPLVEISTQRPVELAAATDLELHLCRGDTGLILTPSLTAAGNAVDPNHTLWVGAATVHGVAVKLNPDPRRPEDPTIRLARLSHPVTRAVAQLLGTGAVRIPAGDEERFVTDYLLPMSDRHRFSSPDGSVTIPVAEPPTLLARITVMPGHRHELSWQWQHRRGPQVRLATLDDESAAGLTGDQAATLAGVLAVARQLPALLRDDGRQLRPAAVTALADSVALVERVLPALHDIAGVSIEVDRDLTDYRSATSAPQVSLAAAETDSRDWFELGVTVHVDGMPVPFVQLFAALAAGDQLFVLPDGTYFPLDTAELGRLRNLIAEARALQDRPGNLRISRYQADLWAELEDLGGQALPSGAWFEQLRRFREPDPDLPPPVGLAATLRPYQLAGFRWLDTLRRNDLGGVLADDMGLGKTVQALAMIAAARADDPSGPPFLVVAPTSVVGNWQAESARFTPGLRTVVVTSTAARRSATLADLAASADVVVCSYTLLRLEAAQYRQIRFAGVLLDEAQAVKNHQAKAFAAIKHLDRAFTVAVTGTPLENNLLELWALFSLVAPGLLGSQQRFADYYRTPVEKQGDADRLALLRRRIGPFLLRRTKEAVAPDLPAKQEQVLRIPLEPAHRTFYDRYLQRERQKVLGMLGDLEGNRFAIFRSLTLLRQASLDPALVDPASEAASTKLAVLRDLVDEVVAGGHRALVFSQFTSFLGQVRRQLDRDGIGYCYLDGSTRNRPAVLDRFRTGVDPLFLISLKAGGVGLNLTEADYCILLDPWWNPATEAQAVDRAHRIGQQRTVLVYRLVAADTVEDKVMALKAGKAELFDSVLGDGAGSGGSISAEDIRSLLE